MQEFIWEERTINQTLTEQQLSGFLARDVRSTSKAHYV